jgi:hypothetical protein
LDAWPSMSVICAPAELGTPSEYTRSSHRFRAPRTKDFVNLSRRRHQPGTAECGIDQGKEGIMQSPVQLRLSSPARPMSPDEGVAFIEELKSHAREPGMSRLGGAR